MTILSIVGVFLVLFIGIRFFKEIGNSLPILELMLLIAGLQWIIGAFNAYRLSVDEARYYMYVDEASYMSFVVPAFCVFAFVVLGGLQRRKVHLRLDFTSYNIIGKYLLFIGIFSDFINSFVPGSLLFFIFLLSQFKFVGTSILLFSKKRGDRLFFYLAIFYLLMNALRTTMFHDLILWSVFLFLIWSLKNKPSKKLKFIIVLTGVVSILSIQMAKLSFRQTLWEGYSGSKISLFVNIINQNWSEAYFENRNNLNNLNVRLNQGWIISAIMDNVPNSTPYAKGETIKEAVLASVLPRTLHANKKEAGGQVNFRKYTGLNLQDSTSMGLSILGESYANYGYWGGIIFMMLWGVFIVIYWSSLVHFLMKHPLLIFFFPVIFLQVVKAETELVVVLNHLIKSTVVVTLFFWTTRKIFNWSI